MRWLVIVAGVMGASGLIGATLYAHARPVSALAQAAYIALFHAPVLLWLSRERYGLFPLIIAMGFVIGVSLFTGTIYLRYLGGIRWATAAAPAGGTLLILTWIGLGLWGMLNR
ncbi:MAG: DUF423 domain-containing protein [Bacteroidia bacterium]|nr:DUF423 domain-containing protein [Bacteroidia bacterium]